MYIIGFLFYIAVFISYFFVEEVHEVISHSYMLAQAISTGMIGLYLYPLFIFTYFCLTSKRTEKYKKIIETQTKMAASVSVSLGLIGTFHGLTAMVSAIAQSMGGNADVTEKMNSMLTAISSALSAMSFAFLTSILGVAVSVLLLISLNFWLFYFKSAETKSDKNRRVIIKHDGNLFDNLIEIERKLIALNEKVSTQTSFLEKNMNHIKDIREDVSRRLDSLNETALDISKTAKEQLLKIDMYSHLVKNKLKGVMELFFK